MFFLPFFHFVRIFGKPSLQWPLFAGLRDDLQAEALAEEAPAHAQGRVWPHL